MVVSEDNNVHLIQSAVNDLIGQNLSLTFLIALKINVVSKVLKELMVELKHQLTQMAIQNSENIHGKLHYLRKIQKSPSMFVVVH